MNKILPSLEVIITCHREKYLILQSLRSAIDAIENAKNIFPQLGISIVLFLDNPDYDTLKIAKDVTQQYGITMLTGSYSDPGCARLNAISQSKQTLIALLDGDDLWSENWIAATYQEIEKNPDAIHHTIYHPEYNLIFGGHNLLFRQGNENDYFFDPAYLRIANYWDALCIASKDIFLRHPYKPNDLDNGYAHEDYLFSCETLISKIKHQIISNTIHFKRRRHGSVSTIAEDRKARCRPTILNDYSFYLK